MQERSPELHTQLVTETQHSHDTLGFKDVDNRIGEYLGQSEFGNAHFLALEDKIGMLKLHNKNVYFKKTNHQKSNIG